MLQLFCENEFCIYQKQGNCILESVQLDIQGNCVDCIYIDIDEDTLSNLKKKLLKELAP
ncbi:MAG: hypothetical protein IJA44_06750 [Clostridia bacterium]|nr:hypothetical protein [Clostridia bacterium]